MLCFDGKVVSVSNTANLPTVLKTGVGARVMLTNNLDISDRLINQAICKVLYMDVKIWFMDIKTWIPLEILLWLPN